MLEALKACGAPRHTHRVHGRLAREVPLELITALPTVHGARNANRRLTTKRQARTGAWAAWMSAQSNTRLKRQERQVHVRIKCSVNHQQLFSLSYHRLRCSLNQWWGSSRFTFTRQVHAIGILFPWEFQD